MKSNDKSLPKTLGEKVREHREAAGLSQEGLALKAFDRKRKARISEIETGKAQNPGLADLQKIARALDVPLVDLLPADEDLDHKVTEAEKIILKLIEKLSKHRGVLVDAPDALARIEEEIGFSLEAAHQEADRRRRESHTGE